jgi:hypothetical protein
MCVHGGPVTLESRSPDHAGMHAAPSSVAVGTRDAMRHATPLLLALVVTGCSTDEESTSTGALSVYLEPCDLSSVATVDVNGVHIVVENDRLLSDDMDLTDLVKPLLCVEYPTETVLDAVELGDWLTLEIRDGVAIHGEVIADGDRSRLVYEKREVFEGALQVFRGEILEKTRSWTMAASMSLPGAELDLDTTFEQIVERNPGAYTPNTYTYTFK